VVVWPWSVASLAGGVVEGFPQLDAVAGAAVTIHYELLSDALAKPLGGLLGTREVVRTIHGMVASVTDRLDAQGGELARTMRVVPRAHNLALVETYQVFLETSLPDILRAKLEAGGLVEGEDYELRL